MKILMIGLDGVAPTQWLGDKNLPHWQWLMEIGCYGKLEDAIQSGTAAARAIGDELERAGKRVRTIGALPSSRDQRSNERNAGLSGTRQDVGEIYEQTRQHFHSARDLMPSGEWDCIQILENGFDQIQGAGNASHD
jgi:predicted AlkP superfamily phosphohydrolase/phosphomutase